MLTRAKICHSKPKSLLTHTISQPKWLQAMKLEYAALLDNQTWTITTLSPYRNPAGCKWVFKVKENIYETMNKYKACLVAKGYHQ